MGKGRALDHGDFLDWLERELTWSQRTAYNMIAAAERFKLATVANLPIEPSALYLLAEKKTPDAVVEQALEAARKGEVIIQAKAKALAEASELIKGEAKPAP